MQQPTPKPLVSRQTALTKLLRTLAMGLPGTGRRGLSLARTWLVLCLCIAMPLQAVAMTCQHTSVPRSTLLFGQPDARPGTLMAGLLPESHQSAHAADPAKAQAGASDANHTGHCPDHAAASQAQGQPDLADTPLSAPWVDHSAGHHADCDRACAACCAGAWLPTLTTSARVAMPDMQPSGPLRTPVLSPRADRLERPPKATS